MTAPGMNFGWLLKPLYASIFKYQNFNSSTKEGDKTNLQSQYDRNWKVERICLVNNLKFEPTANTMNLRTQQLLPKSSRKYHNIKSSLQLDIFLSRIRNCIRIVPIIKPSHWPTCIRSKHGFFAFIFKPDNSKSFWWIIFAAAADTLSGWPNIPSFKYKKQFCAHRLPTFHQWA